MPDGHAEDVFAEAERYETAIEAAGGIDLQLLGMGRNGHVGFNEPGSSLASVTRIKALTRDTLEANKDDLEGSNPEAALTMGLGTILNARQCLLLATGGAKAYAVKAMAEGPLTGVPMTGVSTTSSTSRSPPRKPLSQHPRSRKRHSRRLRSRRHPCPKHPPWTRSRLARS